MNRLLGDWEEKDATSTLKFRTAVESLHLEARLACLAWWEAVSEASIRYPEDMRNMFVHLLRAVGFPGRHAVVHDFMISDATDMLLVTGGAHARIMFRTTSALIYREFFQMGTRQVKQLLEAGVKNLRVPTTFYVLDIHFHSIQFKEFTCSAECLVDKPSDFHREVDFTVPEQRQELVDVLIKLKELVDSEAEELELPSGFDQERLGY